MPARLLKESRRLRIKELSFTPRQNQGLSFLGLGDPNVVSWGQVISNGKTYLPKAWWITTFPGIMTVFTVLTFFLIGEGLNRILSPKMDANK